MSDPDPEHDPRNWIVIGDLSHLVEYERAASADLEAEQGAEAEGVRPLALTVEDWAAALETCEVDNRIPRDFLAAIPHLGIESVAELYPGEYEMCEWYFVDRTGFDLWKSGGAALSIGSLCMTGLAMTREHGPLAWSVYSPGSYQIHVASFKPITAEDQPDP